MIKRSPIRKRRNKPRHGRLEGDDLEALRYGCHKRDLGICQECRCLTFPDLPHTAPNSYHMAHIKAKRMGGDNIENVRTLCGTCHRKEHNWGKSMTKPCPPKSIDTDYL